jgi:hypothetical protein
MNRLVCVGFFFMIVLSAQAVSQDALYPDFYTKGKGMALHGQGSVSCGTFIKDMQPYNRQIGVHYQNMAWVLGFLYGVDRFNPYDVKSYDYNGLELWLGKYCLKNPLELLANAANQFYIEIGGRAPMSEDTTMWRHYPSDGKHP